MANYLTKKDKTTKVMKLKIVWIKFKSIVHLPIYRKDILIWTKYYYTTYEGLCCAIESSIRDLIHVYNRPQHLIPLFSPYVVRIFHEKHGVDIRPTQYIYGLYWWEPHTWELNGGRLGFLNWLIEQYKDDKTNLRKL